ncbi:hypothetical protein QUA62_26145 [Microcoleus sp. MON1_C1]
METEPLFVAAGDRLRQPLTECRLVFLVKKAEIKTNQPESKCVKF